MSDEEAEPVRLDLVKVAEKLQAEWNALSPEEQERRQQKSRAEMRRDNAKRIARMTKAELALAGKIGRAYGPEMSNFDNLTESEREWVNLASEVLMERDRERDAAEHYRNCIAIDAPHVGEC
jgi:hypothetical protein